MSDSRDLNVRISFGDYAAFVNAEGVSYAPDALHDMVQQCVAMFRDGYAVVREDMIALDNAAADADDEA